MGTITIFGCTIPVSPSSVVAERPVLQSKASANYFRVVLTILLNWLCYEPWPICLVADSNVCPIVAMKTFMANSAVNGSSGIWPCENHEPTTNNGEPLTIY